MKFGIQNYRNFEDGTAKEWLLTNGIGGFACSTLTGANTRRYHSLLTASLKPPVMRHLVFSKIDEAVTIENTNYDLYTNETTSHVGCGFKHLKEFEISFLPTYKFMVEDVYIEKTISMVYGFNKTVVSYKIQAGKKPVKLTLAPLMNFRDFHFTTSKSYLNFEVEPLKDGFNLKPTDTNINIFASISDGEFTKYEDTFFEGMKYRVEEERGLDCVEDHYIPGVFTIEVPPLKTKTVTVTVGLGEFEVLSADKVFKKERERRQKLIAQAGLPKDEFTSKLVLAADNFIVERDSTKSKTIIAGYPWFTDWGRDTMIALPGLTLVTKRFDEAKEILLTFSKYIKNGLIPNVFPDGNTEPYYNTVDASLWYFNAVYQYLKYTKDYKFVEENLFDKLVEIIESYKNGTDYNIKMDENDGLINAGTAEHQLTWMDAMAGNYVVTPRFGKPVEINALWYNALCVMSNICVNLKKPKAEYDKLAKKVKKSFNSVFWNEEKSCLYDVVYDGDIKDGKIRPNQIFAVSLDFNIVEKEKAEKIVETVLKLLYAELGLKSLEENDEDFKGEYTGNSWERDSAYHQGTVWSYLIGGFITAYVKVNDNSKQSKDIAAKLLMPLKEHLKDACLNSVSEIFDGTFPHKPRGCFAQAWGVSEILRCYIEDIK